MNDGRKESFRNQTSFEIVHHLKACTKPKDLGKGFKLHAVILERKFLEKSCYVASALLSMYARCGALAKAEEVLEDLPDRNVITWTALIAGYVQHGQSEKALKWFDSMQCEGHSPDAVTFICALKACGTTGAVVKGEKIHTKVLALGILKKDIVLGTALVDMYARCGALAKAQQVLNQLTARNVITWTILIAGYTQEGQWEEALKCFDNMQCEGHSPDAIAFMCALKACGSIGAAIKAQQIHDMVVGMGMLEKDVVLGNTLVDVYARCGAVAKAQQVLNELPNSNVVTWTTLIAGYIQHGQSEKALECFDSMQCEGHSPDSVSFIFALKACGIIGTTAKGVQIHDKIVSRGMLEKDFLLGSALIEMYARCGALSKAQEVLNELSIRNTISWTTLIAGYAQHGKWHKALECFDTMQSEGHIPDVITFICALKACGSIGAVVKGKLIHDKVVSLHMIEKDIALGNAIIDMYVRCGALIKAHWVLNELPTRNAIVWTALIAGYAEQGQSEEALKCFDDMQHEGHTPDVVTFVCTLKACGSIGEIVKGEKIHDKIASLGLLHKDFVLGSALVDMYARCGAIAKAQRVFDELSARNAITWTALMTGYAQQGQSEEVLKCFESMESEGHCPSVATFIYALKACGSIGSAAKVERLHDKIVILGILEKEVALGSTLVDMYARCGALPKAQQVFYVLPVRSVVAWTALIAGYAEQGQCEEALKCFDSMQCDDHPPDVVTFICALKACGSMGAAIKGEQIHSMIVNFGLLDTDIELGNALVDMHVKCASFLKAVEVLEKLPVQNVAMWNSVIAGYGQQGQIKEAFKFLERIQFKGVKPDSGTLVAVLYACSHSGLLDAAELNFLSMSIQYGITPDVEHYYCMVDLFGRAGKFNRALLVIEKMPYVGVPVWPVLLGACQKWADMKIGRLAFENALLLDNNDSAIYVSMANIYAATDM